MKNETGNTDFKIGIRIGIVLSAVSFGLYVLNVLIGKAIIVYGWKVFHFGSIGEFLILLIFSIAFIAAALFKEAAAKSKPQTK